MPVPRWRGVGSGLSGDTIVVSSPRRGKGAHHVARPSILNCWLPPFLKDQVNATALHGIFTPNLHKDAVVGWEGTVPRACGHKQHKWGAGRAIYRVPRTGCTVPFPHHWSSPRETKCWGLRLSLTMEGVGRASLPRASFSSCPFSWPNGDASLEIQKQSKWRRMCPHGQPAPRSCLSGGKWGREPHYDIRPASPLGHKWSGSLEHLVWPSSCLTPRKKRRPPALPPPPAPPAIHPSTGASERCCHVCECVYVCVRQLGVVPLFYFFFPFTLQTEIQCYECCQSAVGFMAQDRRPKRNNEEQAKLRGHAYSCRPESMCLWRMFPECGVWWVHLFPYFSPAGIPQGRIVNKAMLRA